MSDTVMKAVRIHEFGEPSTLRYEDIDKPEPGAGEVLVEVAAAAVNPPDWYVREGMPGVPEGLLPPLELPLVLGTDVSGTVVGVSADVTDFAVGDDVFGVLRFPAQMQAGAYAQYVAAPATDLARKPATVPHEDAAGASMAALTAWQFLVDNGKDHYSPFQPEAHQPVPINPGDTVLVNGAAGGVGHFAVQLAKWRGAHVIAVASTDHEPFLRELGADEFIDYTKAAPQDVARDVDLVLDAVGGPTSPALLPVLKRGGAIYPVYFAEYDADDLATRGVTASTTQVRSDGQQLEQIARLIENGVLRVGIDSTYPLADARKAHERAARGHIQGKIILAVA